MPWVVWNPEGAFPGERCGLFGLKPGVPKEVDGDLALSLLGPALEIGQPFPKCPTITHVLAPAIQAVIDAGRAREEALTEPTETSVEGAPQGDGASADPSPPEDASAPASDEETPPAPGTSTDDGIPVDLEPSPAPPARRTRK